MAMGAVDGCCIWVVGLTLPVALGRWWPAGIVRRVCSGAAVVGSLCLCSMSIGAADAKLVVALVVGPVEWSVALLSAELRKKRLFALNLAWKKVN
jgi:DTW domain-containing protein YfiP